MSKHVVINLPVADLSKSMDSSRHSTFHTKRHYRDSVTDEDARARVVLGLRVARFEKEN